MLYFVVLSVAFALTVLFDRKRYVLHMISKVWCKSYYAAIPAWKVKTRGMENVEKGKAYVVVVNHRSMLDILLMYALPLNLRWVAKKEVYRWPIFGWVMWMHGDIAIERGTASAIHKMVRDGKKWLDMGVSVMVFPEGSRGKVEKVGKFREGAFLLAETAGVDILPCAAYGTGTAFIGWKFNFKNIFALRVLPPIPAEQAREWGLKQTTGQVQRMISEEHDRMAEEYRREYGQSPDNDIETRE